MSGPAFPVAPVTHGGPLQQGMSHRDFFAAQAMAGMCANPMFWNRTKDEHGAEVVQVGADVVAGNAYRLADAMLAERAK